VDRSLRLARPRSRTALSSTEVAGLEPGSWQALLPHPTRDPGGTFEVQGCARRHRYPATPMITTLDARCVSQSRERTNRVPMACSFNGLKSKAKLSPSVAATASCTRSSTPESPYRRAAGSRCRGQTGRQGRPARRGDPLSESLLARRDQIRRLTITTTTTRITRMTRNSCGPMRPMSILFPGYVFRLTCPERPGRRDMAGSISPGLMRDDQVRSFP
jgi:hypothetical protein